jgi:hypothetical protein
MKKIILFAAIPIMLFSCKKSKSDNLPENTITATINDTDYIFNNSFTSETLNDGLEVAYVAQAVDSALPVTTFDFAAVTLNGKAIAPGVYAETGDNTKEASAELHVPGLVDYKTAGTKADPFTVIITSVNGNSIQGTFHGNIYKNGDSLQAKKIITNGKFNMDR